MKNFFTAFKILPKGWYRLNIAFSILLPLALLLFIINEPNVYTENLVAACFWSFIIYWLLARIALWVYLGFKEDKK